MAVVLYEDIMNATMALIRATCGTMFKTYSRKLLTWEELINARGTPDFPKQPALYLYDGVGFGGGLIQYEQGGRAPGKRVMLRSIVMYAQLPGSSTPGGTDINTPGGSIFHELISRVESAFEPNPASSFGVVNLGGLVTHCWIQGDGVIVPGDIDPNGQGMATLPLHILIP